ncbi:MULTISPECIES: hypothetical protein [unclassified Agrococcus]|uniref:hypothetical protein n=1 Tax=unclassified Agrococcus TaxID=2615065 RepID=UPI0036165305
MTDYDGPPLTRRERKERERALAEATGQTPAVDASSLESPAPEPTADEQVASQPLEAATPETDEAPAASESRPTGEPDETQAIDVSELIADLRPQSAPASDAPVAGVPAASETVVPDAAPPAEPAPEPAPTGFGRFFGRRSPAADEQPVEQAADDQQEAPESIGDVLADLQGDRPEPTRPEGVPMPRIEVDELDTVDDAEIDRLEIDEVVVADAPVSSRRIAESTPALLEDDRPVAGDEDDVETQAGPSRATGRLPVIVNVVEDTSRHHIADLREDTSAISASSVGTGTSTITANALVLPASGAHEPITVETADGVIVTGSIDLPDGFASSGRSRGTIDTSDVDAADDGGEVRSPETQPVRASRAVSSYANARVRIAPQRRSRNVVPLVVAVGGAVGISAVTVTVIAFIVGWI